IRESDQQLESLFAPIRPQPGFEDRMISSLRTASAKNGFRLPMIGWIGLSAAAAVVVGVVGATMDKVVLSGDRRWGDKMVLGDMEERIRAAGVPVRDAEAAYYQPGTARSKDGDFVASGRPWDYREYVSGGGLQGEAADGKPRIDKSQPVDKMAEVL